MRFILKNIFIIFIYLFISSNLSFAQENVSKEKELEKALNYYKVNSYRKSLDILKKQKTLPNWTLYLKARDYQELRQYKNSVDIFKTISLKQEDIKNEKYYPFLLENVLFYYTKALSKDRYMRSSTVIKELKKNITLLDPSSIYHDAILLQYIDILWNHGEYEKILEFKGKDKDILTYQNMSRFILGQKAPISQILLAYKDFPNRYAYQKILPLIPIDNLNSRTVIEAMIDSSMSQNLPSLALKATKRHYTVTQDKDYYERNMALYESKIGYRSQALNRLLEFEKTKKASLLTYQVLTKYIVSYSKCNTYQYVFKRGFKKYGSPIFKYYVLMLYNSGQTTKLLNIYKLHYHNEEFHKEHSATIFQGLLRSDTKKAEKMLDYAYKEYKDKDLYIVLMKALFYIEHSEYKKAYPLFLDVLLLKPFGYEASVAKFYEKKYYPQFKDIFEKEMIRLKNIIKTKKEKDQVLSALSLKEIHPEIYEKYVDSKKIEKTHDKMMHHFISLSKPHKKLSHQLFYKDPHMQLWNKEMANYLDHEIKELSKESTTEVARYTLEYSNLFKDIDQYGTLVSRLYTYAYAFYGSHRYNALLPLEVQKLLFPLLEYDKIKKGMGNENDALWVISAFRSESLFKKDVHSSVGAVGYAQLMPYTADILKFRMKKTYFDKYDFEDNLEMGIYLYKDLFRRLHHYAYALSAYNAGEPSVNSWRKKYKNFKTELWIETISYPETRNYVKKIIDTRSQYSRIYEKEDFVHKEF